MDCKIVEKDAIKLVGVSKVFNGETAYMDIPKFWDEHYKSDKCKYICGMYGVCIESENENNKFEYMIADEYDEKKNLPSEFKVIEIPKHTWAVFTSVGPIPKALQDVNTRIYTEWLPNSKEYEFAGGYSIEHYSDIKNYKKGNQDENYVSEIWIQVNKK